MMSRSRNIENIVSPVLGDLMERRRPWMNGPDAPTGPILPVTTPVPVGKESPTSTAPAGNPLAPVGAEAPEVRQIRPMVPRQPSSPGLQQMRRRLLTTAFPRLY